MKRLILWTLTFICIVGCRGTGQKMAQDSLAELPFFTQSARGFEFFELLEGLPHQTFEKEALKKEIKDKDTINLNGYWFYEKPLEIPAKVEEELRDIISDKSSYAPYSGMKRCGGFHPDYGVELLSKAEVVYFYICFGCGEIKVYGGKHELHVDLSDEGATRLKNLLIVYNQNSNSRN